MDIGIFILFIFFILIDLLLCYKPIPILDFPLMALFAYIGITVFYPMSDTVLPLNPITTVVFLVITGFSILVNALDINK